MSTLKNISEETSVEYQRWEPDSLSGDVAMKLPTADSLERIHDQAYQEGYETGLREGKDEGYCQGQQQAQDEAARVQSLMETVNEALQQFEQEVSQQLLLLALDIAKQMFRQALKVKPELVLPIVRDVMDSIPQHVQHPHLHLHPEDAVLVRTLLQVELAKSSWRVVDDHRIERGGCRIETPISEIDATLPTRWKRLAAIFGQDLHWMDE